MPIRLKGAEAGGGSLTANAAGLGQSPQRQIWPPQTSACESSEGGATERHPCEGRCACHQSAGESAKLVLGGGGRCAVQSVLRMLLPREKVLKGWRMVTRPGGPPPSTIRCS